MKPVLKWAGGKARLAEDICAAFGEKCEGTWYEPFVGSGAVYLYRFDHPVPVKQPPSFGAFHTGEVPYVFGNLDNDARPWTELDRRVSWEIQSRWLAFMKHGDPNSADLTPWPRVSEASEDVMVFDSAAAMRPAVSSAERWEALQRYVQAGGTLSLF